MEKSVTKSVTENSDQPQQPNGSTEINNTLPQHHPNGERSPNTLIGEIRQGVQNIPSITTSTTPTSTPIKNTQMPQLFSAIIQAASPTSSTPTSNIKTPATTNNFTSSLNPIITTPPHINNRLQRPPKHKPSSTSTSPADPSPKRAQAKQHNPTLTTTNRKHNRDSQSLSQVSFATINHI